MGTDAGQYINRVTQRSPDEDRRVQRIGVIMDAVFVAAAAIIINFCWWG